MTTENLEAMFERIVQKNFAEMEQRIFARINENIEKTIEATVAKTLEHLIVTETDEEDDQDFESFLNRYQNEQPGAGSVLSEMEKALSGCFANLTDDDNTNTNEEDELLDILGDLGSLSTEDMENLTKDVVPPQSSHLPENVPAKGTSSEQTISDIKAYIERIRR